jgi:hypothetical protein
MDYMAIITDGLAEPDLIRHLQREQRKAADQYYTPEEFYDGCRRAVDELAAAYNYEVDLNKDLQDLNPGMFVPEPRLSLMKYTGGRLWQSIDGGNIQYIRDCIDEAERLTIATAPTPEPVTTPAPQTFPDYLNFEDPKKREGLAEAIREIMRYKDPKDWAALFIALRETNKLIEKHRVRSAMHRIMKAYFGDNIGHLSGFMNYTKNGLNFHEKQQDKTMARLIKEYIDKIEFLEF